MAGRYHSLRSCLWNSLHTVHDVLRPVDKDDKQEQPCLKAPFATLHIGDILFGDIDYWGRLKDDTIELHRLPHDTRGPRYVFQLLWSLPVTPSSLMRIMIFSDISRI